MDGATELTAATALDPGPDAACTLRVVRDADGELRSLALVGIDAGGRQPEWMARLTGRDAEAGDAAFVVTASPTADAEIWTARLAGPDTAGDARLRELNHRVLNSLAMLSSIIGLESRAIEEGAGRAALERVRSRLVAVSNLYRILSAGDGGPTVRADLYLRSVADAVAASVGSGERIVVEVCAAPVELTTSQAAALGLLTNEAMTNAYKHAFAGRSRGRVVVSFAEEADGLVLTVGDDGTGRREGARSGLGTTLMGALASDLGGEVHTDSGSGGTSVRVTVPRAG